jgi:hypothetical protein
VLKPIDAIDSAAVEVAKSLDGFVYSIEGLYEKFARENPSMSGFRMFMQSSQAVRELALDSVMTSLDRITTGLKLYMSAPEQFFVSEHDDSESFRELAYRAIGSFLEQVIIACAKKFRAIISAKAFTFDTYTSNPKIVLGQSGRKWNFTEFAYLTVRQLLVDWYNQSKIAYIESIGVKEFTLDTQNIELIGQVYLIEDFPAITESLFHPRTTKLVGGPNVQT